MTINPAEQDHPSIHQLFLGKPMFTLLCTAPHCMLAERQESLPGGLCGGNCHPAGTLTRAHRFSVSTEWQKSEAAGCQD